MFLFFSEISMNTNPAHVKRLIGKDLNYNRNQVLQPKSVYAQVVSLSVFNFWC